MKLVIEGEPYLMKLVIEGDYSIKKILYFLQFEDLICSLLSVLKGGGGESEEILGEQNFDGFMYF